MSGRSPNETVRMGLVGRIEPYLPPRHYGLGLTEVNHRGSEQADPGMTMLLVVPVEELLAEGAAVLDAAESVRDLRAIFHGAKLAFRMGCHRKCKAGYVSW